MTRRPVVVALLGLTLSSCTPSTPTTTHRLIVIGVDGMDPGFLQRHWQDLPHLDKLRRAGEFQPMRTTSPPQSPVAWSTFITGLDPAGHGIFDFVHRDPQTLQPVSSITKTEPGKFNLPLGPYVLPLSKPRITALRHGEAFWEVLSDHGIPATVLRMPTNYPPIPTPQGRALAGMGTPDLRGGFGTFSFYSDDPEEITRTVSGGDIVKVAVHDFQVDPQLQGPPDGFIPVHIDIDPIDAVARVSADGREQVLREKEWSDWFRVRFPLMRGFIHANGMFRVYLKQLHPRFELYISPVNVDPSAAVLPISTPPEYAEGAAAAIGPFYTQGIAEDTAALRAGVFNLGEYLAQSHLVFEDEKKLLRFAAGDFRAGLLFAYFSIVDQNSHVLWGKHEAELLTTYQGIDAVIGRVRRDFPDADLIVMSDHGFTSYERSFQLNTWLLRNGFRTQAYGLGLNGLYLKGRQPHAVIERLRAVLLAYRDPDNGRQVVQSVTLTRLPPNRSGPDMIVGYSAGYRASWQTALGGTTGNIIEDNNDAWIGDHCVDPQVVPAVLLSSRKLKRHDPELKDLPVSILQLFGIPKPSTMTGRPLFDTE